MNLDDQKLTIPAAKLARIFHGQIGKTTIGADKTVVNTLIKEVGNYFSGNVPGFDEPTWLTACGVIQKTVAA
jgi:hypothetical protein